MNCETQARRFDIAMRVMQRVAKSHIHRFDINSWQTAPFGVIIQNETDATLCGTTACFSGWMALSPEAQAEGAGISATGSMDMPVDDAFPVRKSGSSGMALFLGISLEDAIDLVSPAHYNCSDPNAWDVLDKLHKMRDKYLGAE